MVLTPYVRNRNTLPKNFKALYQHFEEWTRDWDGANLAYEYHFWRHQAYDVGGISLARVLNGDIKFYKSHKINGTIQDGTQRGFFPTGLAFYTYARTLYDVSLSAEEIAEEYFLAAFGEDWRLFYDYLERLGDAFGHDYFSGTRNRNSNHSEWYDPEQVKSLEKVKDIVAEGRALIASHYNSDYRVRTVSVRLLEFHALYAELVAKAMIAKAQGNDDESIRLMQEASDECGKYELAFERWYDHYNIFAYLQRIAQAKTLLNRNDVESA